MFFLFVYYVLFLCFLFPAFLLLEHRILFQFIFVFLSVSLCIATSVVVKTTSVSVASLPLGSMESPDSSDTILVGYGGEKYFITARKK